jgi:uncharacterized membrane protein YeaQ/YmgE (transglycosylase-associated protein family)
MNKNQRLLVISAFFAGLVAGPITTCLFNNLDISTLKSIMLGLFVATISSLTYLALCRIFKINPYFKNTKKNEPHDIP